MTRASLRAREAYRHWQTIPTRWADNDAYGHVNNATYYAWFDTAVNNWLIGAGLIDIAGGNPIGVVVASGCRYAAPVSYPQPVEAGIMISRLGTSSVTFEIGIFAAEAAEPAAEGFFTHVYVDRASRRPVPLEASWRGRLQELTASD